ncbi:MAG: membrane or secreted protein [Flavobacteriaceae bacterium]|nr:membrane or secreted protein [Flavobacteriaceae bacterium]
MKLFLLTFGLLLLAFAGIAIKIWAKKDGKFAGTCASQNPHLNKDGQACGYCGRVPEQFHKCENDHAEDKKFGIKNIDLN